MTLPTMTSVNGLPVARMPADVDAANAPLVGERLADAVNADARRLVLDLRGTRYLDSAGIDMLLKLHDRLRRRRQALHLVLAEDSPLRRLFEITAIDRSIPLHPDLEDVMRAPGSRVG